ncbi:hypothetical protein GCM10019016_056500 [Streptomyces prasinosporus]|uniref:Uncharacterized protein n=1 Tax=Streptomyces prasinosporus TaxID=68256 RepID=A0ABP6TTD3_9ACTN|nr:hypothetical protein GCM10010332_35910 [Streptomyces albogriseolus]
MDRVGEQPHKPPSRIEMGPQVRRSTCQLGKLRSLVAGLGADSGEWQGPASPGSAAFTVIPRCSPFVLVRVWCSPQHQPSAPTQCSERRPWSLGWLTRVAYDVRDTAT